jgi:hypothetical protein
MLAAAIVGSKKNRRRFALHIFLGLSDDAKSMLLDVFKLYQMKKVSEVNSIITRTTNTTREVISVLSPENRPAEFSSGKIFDRTTWTMYQTRFKENGYCEPAASLLAGIFLFELEELLNAKKAALNALLKGQAVIKTK